MVDQYAQRKVILVDSADNQLGEMDLLEAHRGDGKLHRAISVFLFSDDGELLMQQRSDSKIVAAGEWANTVCGNVAPGESYLECAVGRLQYELGITFEPEKLRIGPKFQYQLRCNEEFSEHEIDQVFWGIFSGDILPNPDEVVQTRWVDLESDLNEIKVAPWFTLMLENGVIDQVKDSYANR